MFWSKKKQPKFVASAPSVLVSQMVDEIHNAFDRASDEALKEAKRILARPVDEEQEKINRLLMNAGFTAMKQVTEHVQREFDASNARKRADVVNHYAQKYPHYKFIFADQVTAICNKYGLIWGEVSRYKGTVPKKNALEIAAFKVEDSDVYVRERYGSYGTHFWEYPKTRQPENTGRQVPFYICAPASDMVMDDKDRVNEKTRQIERQVEIPDPIVLHYVKDGYLIVSKWGPEASDPAVVNEKHN